MISNLYTLFYIRWDIDIAVDVDDFLEIKVYLIEKYNCRNAVAAVGKKSTEIDYVEDAFTRLVWHNLTDTLRKA